MAVVVVAVAAVAAVGDVCVGGVKKIGGRNAVVREWCVCVRVCAAPAAADERRVVARRCSTRIVAEGQRWRTTSAERDAGRAARVRGAHEAGGGRRGGRI